MSSGLALAQPTAAPPAPAAPEAFGALPESYPWVRLAEALMPAVVNVRTATEVKRGQAPAVPDPSPRFMPAPQDPRSERRRLGSGFVVDPSGYIVTNHHV